MNNYRFTTKVRDVGLAQERYLESGEFEIRQNIAKSIREIANRNRIANRLTGNEKFTERGLKLSKQADRFELCRTQYLHIGCKGCQSQYLTPKRCEVRICPVCGKKYNFRIRKKQTQLLKQFPNEKIKKWRMLTVTKKIPKSYIPKTSDAISLYENFRKLFNKLFPKSLGCGAFAVIEVGENNNLHIHALVYGHYVTQKKISDIWLELTKDSKIVDIRIVKNQNHSLSYLLKYLTKPIINEDPQKIANYLNLLIGLRRFRTYGVLYNYPLAKKESCPCPFCKGKLGYMGFKSGRYARIDVLLFTEAYDIAKLMIN